MLFEQDLMFPNATYVGEEVTVRLAVMEVNGAVAALDTTVTRPGGEVGLQGRARAQRAGVTGWPEIVSFEP